MRPKFLLCLLAVTAVCSLTGTLAASCISFEVLSIIDYSRAIKTYPLGVNDQNQVAGFYVAAANGAVRGFTLTDGRLSKPIVDPQDTQKFTEITGTNRSGILSGYYEGADKDLHGFLRSASSYIPIDVGQHSTRVNGLNDAGNTCGSIEVETSAFVIIDGVTTTFTIPGANAIEAEGINNLNQAVGYYRVGTTYYGFLRDADGTLSYPILATGATSTFLSGINDKATMSGTSVEGTVTHGVLFLSLSRSVTYDYPGADSTAFGGINNKGVIAAHYFNGTDGHGLVLQTQRRSTE